MAAQHVGHGGEDARLIGGADLQVVGADEAAHAQGRGLFAGGLRHRQLAARQRHQIRHHRRGGGHAARAGADVQRRPHGVAARQHGVHNAINLGQQRMVGHQGQVNAPGHAVGAAARDGQVLDGEAEFAGVADVLHVDAGDALHMHAGEVDARVERERGQHGELLCGVQSFHVERGVGFGVTEALRFGEGGREIPVVVLHGGENVVGRAVDNPRQHVQPVRGQPGPHGVDDGDAAGHGGLVAERQALGVREREERVAAHGQHRLVGRDHRPPGAQARLDQITCRRVAADQFHDHVHGIGRQSGQIRAERGTVQVDVRFWRAAGDAAQRYRPAGPGGNGVAVARQQVRDAGTDGAKAGQADPQGGRLH